jgi:hypothetical protein
MDLVVAPWRRIRRDSALSGSRPFPRDQSRQAPTSGGMAAAAPNPILEYFIDDDSIPGTAVRGESRRPYTLGLGFQPLSFV